MNAKNKIKCFWNQLPFLNVGLIYQVTLCCNDTCYYNPYHRQIFCCKIINLSMSLSNVFSDIVSLLLTFSL